MLQDEINNLREEFKRIQKMGWVPSVEKGTGSVGLTFEKLLGKEIENFEIPDYGNIEIKTHTLLSGAALTLFHAAPDGRYLFEIKRLVGAYGYPDKVLKDYTVLHGNVDAQNKSFIGWKYQFQLKVDYDKEVVVLHIFNRQGTIIDSSTWWTFDLLKEKLYRKLRCMAFIGSDKRYIHNKVYFKYKNIIFYKLTDFNTFLRLIERGVIKISFSIGRIRSGERKGDIYDHGTCFRIDTSNIGDLFEIIK